MISGCSESGSRTDMPVIPGTLERAQRLQRGYAWHFAFRLHMSKHHNIGLIMNNTRHGFSAAKIISYATDEIDSENKVTGLVAGNQMRGGAVQKYL